MPITIVVDSDPHIGPGASVHLTTDFVGPIPLDWRWVLLIVEEPEGSAWETERLADGDHGVFLVVAAQTGEWTVSPLGMRTPAEGTSVAVYAQLTNASFALEDSGTRTDLTWSTQGDFLRQIQTDIHNPGALTAPQAAQLAAISPQVTTAFLGTIGESILRGVSDLILHPPVGFLIEDGDPIALMGRGSLTRPSGPIDVNAFGAVITFFTIPAGFGFRDGAVVEYHERIVQVATTHALANGTREVVTELLELRVDGYLWLWKRALPQRILYDVTPGCLVILRWLGATIPTS